MSIEKLIQELLELNIITPNNKQSINPNAERMLKRRGRTDLINSIHESTYFITSLDGCKLKDRIRILYRDRFSSIDDVPLCKNDNCSEQVLVIAGPYKALGDYCSVKCSNTHKNKESKKSICPETKLPMSKIYSMRMRDTLENTICDVTGLTLEKKRGIATGVGARKVNPETGKSSAQTRAIKEAERRNRTFVGEENLHKLYGALAAESNRKVDDSGLNGYQRGALKIKKFYKTRKGIELKKRTVIAQRKTKLGKNSIKDFSDGDEMRMFRIYKRRVMFFTRQNDLTVLENYERRGNHYKNKHAFHLDHIFSIAAGFEHNIPPYIIGSIYNLQMLHWKENIDKGADCGISKEELFKLFFADS